MQRRRRRRRVTCRSRDEAPGGFPRLERRHPRLVLHGVVQVELHALPGPAGSTRAPRAAADMSRGVCRISKTRLCRLARVFVSLRACTFAYIPCVHCIPCIPYKHRMSYLYPSSYMHHVMKLFARVFVCMHARMLAYMHSDTYGRMCLHVCTYACMRACSLTHVHAYCYIQAYGHTDTCVHTYRPAYNPTHLPTYPLIRLPTYPHTNHAYLHTIPIPCIVCKRVITCAFSCGCNWCVGIAVLLLIVLFNIAYKLHGTRMRRWTRYLHRHISCVLYRGRGMQVHLRLQAYVMQIKMALYHIYCSSRQRAWTG